MQQVYYLLIADSGETEVLDSTIYLDWDWLPGQVHLVAYENARVIFGQKIAQCFREMVEEEHPAIRPRVVEVKAELKFV